MQVTLWYFADCPNWQLAEQRLRQALTDAGHADAEVRLVAVESEADAAAGFAGFAGFAGSPTFTVDGVDLFDTTAPAGTLACRVYPTSHGLAGVPDTADLLAALTERVTP